MSKQQRDAQQMQRDKQSGFTLIEIIIAIGILASLSLYAVNALTNQLDTRNKLQRSNEAIHAAHAAMMRLTDDLRHAYLLSGNEEQVARSNSDVIGRPLFVFNSSPRLLLMTQAHQSLMANRAESNLAYAQYLVCPDLSAPSEVCRQSESSASVKQLVRIVDPSVKKVSDDAVITGTTQVLVNDLKELKFTAWNGQDFVPEWNTERSDYGKRLPKMVKVELSVFMPEDDLVKQARQENSSSVATERPSMALSTIVYLMYSAGQPDLKEAKAEPGWVQ
ncbi:MAG: prepilin-type N-terminal cleavage/methylation domain-containing protein [Betaproteobacteria bacterium]|nr:prepilin-type N-terminal cleavage/methylation domain-containing protein [Betaproteobacteria bacterium]